jgi:hypothetical protein
MTKKERIEQLEENYERIQGVLHENKVQIIELQHQIEEYKTEISTLRSQLECGHNNLGGWEYSITTEYFGHNCFKKCSRCNLEVEIPYSEYTKHMEEEWGKKPTTKTKRKKS